MKKKLVLSLSGGLDSATLLAYAMNERHRLPVHRLNTVFNPEEILCVGFNYGSKHARWEIEKAQMLAAHYCVEYRLINLTNVTAQLNSDLLLSGGEIPEGHYEAESMARTVVPGRNMIFASILAGIAWSCESEFVWLGVHAGDHHIYPDCRPNFVSAMRQAIEFGTDGKVTLHSPFLMISKIPIVGLGMRMGVPFQFTRTCYKNQPVACGRCGSCQERLAAFKAHKHQDPLEYESRELVSA